MRPARSFYFSSQDFSPGSTAWRQTRHEMLSQTLHDGSLEFSPVVSI
jgi:hypothetical protein